MGRRIKKGPDTHRWPDKSIGEYWTATVHELPGPSEVPVQVSDVIENGDGLGRETVSASVAAPPELVSVNVSDGV